MIHRDQAEAGDAAAVDAEPPLVEGLSDFVEVLADSLAAGAVEVVVPRLSLR